MDASYRYTRLSEKMSVVARKRNEEMVAEETKRHKEELDGIAILKPDLKPEKPADKRPRTDKKTSTLVEQNLGHHEFPDDSNLFNSSDFVLYLRWLISETNIRADFSTYILRAKNAISSDTLEFIKDYNFLSSIEPGRSLGENSVFFEGVGEFVSLMPIIPTKIEDFFVEMDYMIQDMKMESPINLEDGRIFAFDAEQKFNEIFFNQCIELTMIPYDGNLADETAGETEFENGIGGFTGNLGIDTNVISLESLSGTAKSIDKSNLTRKRVADWLYMKELSPRINAQEIAMRQYLSCVKNLLTFS